MNTTVTTLFLVLVFAVNGSALDEENSNVASPLMMFGERGKKTNQTDRAGSSNEPIDREMQGRRESEGSYYDDDDDGRGTRTTAKDLTVNTSSSSDQDPALENAYTQFKLAYDNWRKVATPNRSSLSSTDEAAKQKAERLYIERLTNLNVLEKKRGLPATSPDSNLSTPQERYQAPGPLSSSSRTPPYGNQHFPFSNLPGSSANENMQSDTVPPAGQSRSLIFQTHQRQAPLHYSLTLPRPQSENWPHRDSFHLIQLVPNVLSDTPVSAFIVYYWFTIAPKYAVASWLAANVGVSLAVSPHVTRLIEARSTWGGSIMRRFTTPNDVWNPVYFVYYSVAWSIMGMDKTFNVTPLQAASFMVVSGMIRQLGAVIRKRPCFSWDRGNVWNQENLDKLAAGPRNQTLRIIDRWLPDIIPASLARSATRNIYRWHEGESPITAVWPGARQNMILYTVGLVGYYAGYRLVEHVCHPWYRDKARIDQEDLQKLYSNIKQVANFGLALPQESAGEETRLLVTTPNAKISQEALKASLDVLTSSYINLFKDPLLFRDEIKQSCLRLFGINRPTPEAFREAYRIIDLLDIYKGHVTASTTTPEQIQKASQEFLHTLNGPLHNNVQNNDLENNLPPLEIRNFNPLIKLFALYSKLDPTQSNNENVVLNSSQESLLSRAMNAFRPQNGYRAIAEHDEDSRFQRLELSPLRQQQSSEIAIQGDNVSSKNTAATESTTPWFSSYQNSDNDSKSSL